MIKHDVVAVAYSVPSAPTSRPSAVHRNALGAQLAARFDDGAQEADLQIERRVALAGGERRMHRAGHLPGDRVLVRILPRATLPTMDIWLAVHADVRRDPDVIAVLDALAAALVADARALAGKPN